VPPGAHATVNVCPTAPFNEAAFASHVVGVPLPADAGGAVFAEAVFELSEDALVWPPPLLSRFSFEHPKIAKVKTASKSMMQLSWIVRGLGVDEYDDGMVRSFRFAGNGCVIISVEAKTFAR